MSGFAGDVILVPAQDSPRPLAAEAVLVPEEPTKKLETVFKVVLHFDNGMKEEFVTPYRDSAENMCRNAGREGHFLWDSNGAAFYFPPHTLQLATITPVQL